MCTSGFARVGGFRVLETTFVFYGDKHGAQERFTIYRHMHFYTALGLHLFTLKCNTHTQSIQLFCFLLLLVPLDFTPAHAAHETFLSANETVAFMEMLLFHLPPKSQSAKQNGHYLLSVISLINAHAMHTVLLGSTNTVLTLPTAECVANT